MGQGRQAGQKKASGVRPQRSADGQPRRRRLAGGASDPLSDREREALAWAARGKTFVEVAEIMRISRRTVEFHLDNARNKLGVGSRIEAAVKAAVLRLIVP